MKPVKELIENIEKWLEGAYVEREQNNDPFLTENIFEAEYELEKLKKELTMKMNDGKINKMKENIITDLSNFKDTFLKQITVIYDNGEEEIFSSKTKDYILVDENGYFKVTDDNFGIIEFNEKHNSYFHHRFQVKTKLNIVGFVNIITGDKIFEYQFK